MDRSKDYLPTWIILSIILIEGFISIAVEILNIRQLMPVVGNSVVVTSLIIGIFLLFLAYGYRRGGQQKNAYTEKLKTNFFYSALILGVGLSYPFILVFFKITGNFSTHILFGLSLYLLLITAPLIYLLGQTVPITMHLFPPEQRAGKIGGDVLHLSTVGSFLGAVLTSLVLFNFIGVASTVVVLYVLLGLMILMLANNSGKDWQKLAILALASVVIWMGNVHFESTTMETTTAYANYGIRDQVRIGDKAGKLLMINDAPSSFITADKKAFNYIELIKKILFDDLKLRRKEILAIGAGGFTLSAERYHQNRFTYVDIDPELTAVVTPKFLANINGSVVIQDGRQFLNMTQNFNKFDAIVMDTFNTKLSIPPHLLTVEYFQSIRRALKPGGVALFNIIRYPHLPILIRRKLIIACALLLITVRSTL